MPKLALNAVVGETDNTILPNNGQYIRVGTLPFFKYDNIADVSLHEYIAALERLRLVPSERAMDLLIIACTMYGADTRIDRESYAEDSWTRMIDLYIPVSDPEFWDSQRPIMKKIFRFLTGDIWDLNFRARANPGQSIAPRGNRRGGLMPYQTDTVCLFSGGMDSLIGAIDLLSNGIRPLLLGHAKSADVTTYQHNCFEAIKDGFPNLQPTFVYSFVRIPKGNLFDSEDHTERGRSFLFLTLGSICASALQPQSRLIVPENGMISLNIPLTPLRVGSHSTRTTHPHYFSMMQELFDNMNLGVVIQNPYQFKTKGQMLAECRNNNLVANTESMSCSHPVARWQGERPGHCGYCVPCIIRQAAFRGAGIRDNTHYRRNIFSAGGLDITRVEGADVLAFKYLIEKVRRNPAFLTAAIRTTGPLGDDVDAFVNVYRAALSEVEALVAPLILV
ncbi:MAG TPA: Qat anti-phage system QueC-like protein QatC [Puia sp.]|nr:Qat anti-phage system QueC-like protein QatC [Puia sp.]